MNAFHPSRADSAEFDLGFFPVSQSVFSGYSSHRTGQQTQLGNTLQHKGKIIRAGRSSLLLYTTVIGPSIHFGFF